jgi:hypothetical protein
MPTTATKTKRWSYRLRRSQTCEKPANWPMSLHDKLREATSTEIEQ